VKEWSDLPKLMCHSIPLISLTLILAFSLISMSGSSIATDFSEYQDTGFSFQGPVGWIISSSGSKVAGNLSLAAPNSYSSINIDWIRDPGLTPESILDQVAKTYNQDEVEVLSKEEGRILVEGREARTLNLSYKFKEFQAIKRLAAWTSNESDRLFLASTSSCSEEYFGNDGIFNHILTTFRDQRSDKVSLEPRSVQDDVWAIILGDLLASCHYIDQTAYQPTAFYVEAVHSLTPIRGSYKLSSTEKISSKMSETAIIRSNAVQELLHSSGYEARLIQKGGQIWVVVQDPSGKWQSVSINPTEAWRMVGALIAGLDGYQGIVYSSAKELTDENSLKLIDPDQYGNSIQQDCEPPRYVELKRPVLENSSWMNELQGILSEYSYPKKYHENIFDCSNTSQICWAVLEEKGYESSLMLSYKDHPLGQHMWVVVKYPYEDERYVAVEATNTNQSGDLVHLGNVTEKNEYYKGIMYNTSKQYSWLHPEEGMWLESIR
jgi:hypothetical protein